jgi:tryptophan synthase alpha chain
VTGPDRISAAFAVARAEKRPALVTYVMGGDPTLAASARFAEACVAGGADLIELGIPFSDPIADGPTLQRAAERSLAAGTTVAKVLALAKQVRSGCDAPIALMGYLNPVASYGYERFLDACVASGVDALILPDLPPEEAESLCGLAAPRGVATVFLLAPTSTMPRRKAVYGLATGFVYFVSVTGVTGARSRLPADLGEQLDRTRAECPVPLVVGFGVSQPRQVRELGRHADGVVVGSAIVSRAARTGPVKARADAVRRFVRSLRG